MLYKLCFALLAICTFATTNDIPDFTPNVVDLTGSLTSTEVDEINEAFQTIREKTDIWGAVYLVNELKDESIESLAERAFKKWKLGEAKKDNGLLLVLSMNDRQSRFEVGYGLEGDLPDVLAHRVLEEILRPNMRNGDIKTAITASFLYLAGVKSNDSSLTVLSTLPKKQNGLEGLNTPRGYWGISIYLVCLWMMRPFAVGKAISKARKLTLNHSAFTLRKDKSLNMGRMTFRYLFLERSIGSAIFLRCFLSLNPGLFIFLGAGLNIFIFIFIASICVLSSFIYFRILTSRYDSAENYQNYLTKLRNRNKDLIEKGYMRETSPGVYELTSSYFSSAYFKSSTSSSSKSGWSSSGGGRSGGGGSSSSW